MISASTKLVTLNWASAAAWFAIVPPTTTIDASIRRLVGLAACAIASDDPEIAALWRGAQAAANERAAGSAADRFPACDPFLVVLAAAAACGAGLPIGGFRPDLAHLAEQLEARPVSERSHPRMVAVARLLCALGYRVTVDDAQLDAWVPPELALLFDAESSVLANLGHWVTLAGSRERVHAALARIGEPADVIDALVAIAVADCRAYRLTTALDMVRAIQAGGASSAELDEVRNFLALQQRDDGAFGYRNPFKHAATPDDATRFHLPISLATVIAFAEHERRRSLVAAVTEALR